MFFCLLGRVFSDPLLKAEDFLWVSTTKNPRGWLDPPKLRGAFQGRPFVGSFKTNCRNQRGKRSTFVGIPDFTTRPSSKSLTFLTCSWVKVAVAVPPILGLVDIVGTRK